MNEKIYNTLLHYACKSGNFELVKYLLSLNKFNIETENIIQTNISNL